VLFLATWKTLQLFKAVSNSFTGLLTSVENLAMLQLPVSGTNTHRLGIDSIFGDVLKQIIGSIAVGSHGSVLDVEIVLQLHRC
jgi:hypothetical protein